MQHLRAQREPQRALLHVCDETADINAESILLLRILPIHIAIIFLPPDNLSSRCCNIIAQRERDE
jgi:hypothetical protein